MPGGKRIPLTFDERKQIEEMLKWHLSHKDMAKRLGRATSCVDTELRYFKNEPYNAEKAHKDALVRRKKRCTHANEKFSPEDELYIRTKLADNWSILSIRNHLKCKQSNLYAYIKENNLHSRANLTEIFEGRLSALEMQIEILIDQIKELKNERNTKNN